jgi:hypothetical protein
MAEPVNPKRIILILLLSFDTVSDTNRVLEDMQIFAAETSFVALAR